MIKKKKKIAYPETEKVQPPAETSWGRGNDDDDNMKESLDKNGSSSGKFTKANFFFFF